MPHINIYPVYETVKESNARFLKMYELSKDIIGPVVPAPEPCTNISNNWKRILQYWEDYVRLFEGVDFMYEAIFLVRYKEFSVMMTPMMKQLTTLIASELCRCGYAFRVWCNMIEFKNAYYKIMFQHKRVNVSKRTTPVCLDDYLNGTMFINIMLKGKRPIDWCGIIDCNAGAVTYGADHLYYCVTAYKRTIAMLIPESIQWDQEWQDWQYAAAIIKERYKLDFTNDPNGYDNIIGLAAEKNCPRRCAKYLYRLDSVSPELLTVLWGDKAPEMLECCFNDILRRHKDAKRTYTNSRYNASVIAQSWLYRWVDERRSENTLCSRYQQDIKKGLMNIGLNI